ncbi:hypothetical protein HFD88_007009 [Aspergillus terreus]|nr:hypothetical protein HFD88_007009 [Aspergillus terreus]
MVKFTGLIVHAFCLTAFISSVTADSPGSPLYLGAFPNEANGYARVIQLQHAGDQNGKLLATWEHWYTTGPDSKAPNGTAGNFIILESASDKGDAWSTLATVHDPQTGPGHPSPFFYQPFLFEFPKQLGKYPAGTLLLVGNLSNGTSTQFFSWRSRNHGKSWDPVGAWQESAWQNGDTSNGIWEPFLYLDSKGRLVAVFSDERGHPAHSQMLVHVVSEDGSDTWSGGDCVNGTGCVVRDVASPVSSQRPGMASVARMDNGEYFMSYEVCLEFNAVCHVHGITSPDGINWNETDVGVAIETADRISPWASPYTVWDPAAKQLVLGSMQQFLNNTVNLDAPENHRSVFINKNHGKGEWFWAPSPWTAPASTDICSSNRSPDLLPLAGGGIRYTAPAPEGSTGLCGERTGKASIGALPYTADFAADGQAGWIDLGGAWNVSGGEYRFAASNASAVAVTGSSGWKDYELSVDVMISGTSGVVGLSARVSASSTGQNSLKKYTAAISSASGNLTISRDGHDTTVLHSAAHPGGIQPNKWYHLSFAVQADKLTVELAGGRNGSHSSFTSTDGGFHQGMAGLFGKSGSGSFKNVKITD